MMFRSRLAMLGVVGLLAGLLTVALPVGPAAAAGFAVDTTNDTVDANPGDGFCADAAGDCSLRAATMEHNALGGTNTVSVPANTYPLTLAGGGDAGGDLDIEGGTLTITGAGSTSTIVDAAAISDRVLEVGSDTTAALTGLTLRNGDEGAHGGGLQNGGALTLTDVAIVDNMAEDGGGGIHNWNGGSIVGSQVVLSKNIVTGGVGEPHGGGVENRRLSTVILNDSTIVQNEVTECGEGGGVWNESTGEVTLLRVAVLDNFSLCDAGGLQNNGFMEVIDSRVTGNQAYCQGGGFENDDELVIAGSTIAENAAGGGQCTYGPPGNADGGGILQWGELDITNSTISLNTADSGAGIYVEWGDPATLVNVTVHGNTASADQTGGIYQEEGTITLFNTIVADNAGGDCESFDTLTSNGGNLDSDDSCNLTEATDKPGTDPVLGPLADNGGPSSGALATAAVNRTHLPLDGSPAIDMAVDDGCPDDDQRDVARPQDGNDDGVAQCDIGAVEVAPEPPVTPTTTTTTTTPSASPAAAAAPSAPAARPVALTPTFTG